MNRQRHQRHQEWRCSACVRKWTTPSSSRSSSVTVRGMGYVLGVQGLLLPAFAHGPPGGLVRPADGVFLIRRGGSRTAPSRAISASSTITNLGQAQPDPESCCSTIFARQFEGLPQRPADATSSRHHGRRGETRWRRNLFGAVGVFPPAQLAGERLPEADTVWLRTDINTSVARRCSRCPVRGPGRQPGGYLIGLDISHHMHFLQQLRLRLWMGIALAVVRRNDRLVYRAQGPSRRCAG